VGSTLCDVLLIEGDENDVFFFQRGLRGLGFPGVLLVADSPTQAWHMLKHCADENPPALVVSDGFFREDGLKDLVLWMRAHPVFAQTPVVVYSGMTSAEEYVRRQGGETFPVVLKPVDATELHAALRSVLLHLPADCRQWLA
jgi:DNA-binding response OmpR family regulator